MILLLELGDAELFDRAVECAEEPLELVRIADECPGRGSGFLKQQAIGSITDMYQSH